MSLIEIENIIENLSYQDKANLVMNLLNNLEVFDLVKETSSFENEIISRSNDDSSFFIESGFVIKEAKSKYLLRCC
jgi:mannitol/fructose-specific phosphotransferase system IIA component (Ntr-type)